MTIPGQSPIADYVISSLLRLGTDTRGPRLFRDLPGARTPGALADALGLRDSARTAALTRAHAAGLVAVRRAADLGLDGLVPGAPDYPALLQQIPDPPIVLWRLGRDVLDLPSVAVVGSRVPSAAGRAMAARLGQGLAAAGLVVVSGLARGIDAAAHEGALRAGGRTVAVLGSGLDVIYPSQHLGLAEAVRREGCLVSEFPPGTPPLARHFPLRNRIISGLAMAVVVVEAAERSGSLITARAALDQGRTVCAVPGSVAAGGHGGCHALIKDGAGLVETVEDVLAELSWRSRSDRVRQLARNPLDDSGLTEFMPPGAPVSADDLSQRSGQPVGSVLGALAELEVAGIVERTGVGLFVRLD